MRARRNVLTEQASATFATTEALELRLQGWTLQDIAAKFNVTRQTVHSRLKKLDAYIKDPPGVRAFAEAEPVILDGIRSELVSHMLQPEKLAKASISNLAFTYRIALEASRLLRGQSTSNLSAKVSLITAAHDAAAAQLPDQSEDETP